MRERPSRKVAVLVQREAVESRWESHRWKLLDVIPDVGGAPRTLRDEGAILQRLYPGFEATLFHDEAEGHYLNATSEEPSVFVSLRAEESGDVVPFQVTLSYNEAARWMDGSERVERVAAYPELAEWMRDWAIEHYKPEPKKRRKPRSFEGKEGVLRAEGDS